MRARGRGPVSGPQPARRPRDFSALGAQVAPRPRAVACVERDLEELLAFYAFPAAHWRKIRTTNIIERAFREVRRRTRPMSSFTNPASCDRIVFGVVSHLNRSWERKPLKEFTQNA